MTRTIVTTNLEDTLNQLLIGSDRFFEEMNLVRRTDKYPPTNVVQVDETHHIIEMAIAGFSPEDIKIGTERGILTIKSIPKEDPRENRNYIHRGIASRDFSTSFKLYENVVVTGASFKNGILSISLETQIPDHLKATEIKIDVV
jgi:molecular chaperone IbpA